MQKLQIIIKKLPKLQLNIADFSDFATIDVLIRYYYKYFKSQGKSITRSISKVVFKWTSKTKKMFCDICAESNINKTQVGIMEKSLIRSKSFSHIYHNLAIRNRLSDETKGVSTVPYFNVMSSVAWLIRFILINDIDNDELGMLDDLLLSELDGTTID